MPRLSQRALVVVATLTACVTGAGDEESGDRRRAKPTGMEFEDVTTAAGIDFVHENGGDGRLYFIEPVGAGAATFDFDGDGDLDLLFRQSGVLPRPGEHVDGSNVDGRGGGVLYRNEWVPEGRLVFTDVTAVSGITGGAYGMGVAVGDVDGDGDPDLLFTNYGPNELWLNQGNGTFVERGEAAGLADPRWNTSASFFDFDRDGDLDLYVAGYVRYGLDLERPCRTSTGAPNYCGPNSFPPISDRLYRNRGDGVFEDVSYTSGIARQNGPGLGVLAQDVDGDGWIDVFVANDLAPNMLWRNQGDGTFEEGALFAGVAVNARGESEASMGIAMGDVDNDGSLDLFLSHLEGETNTLLRGLGDGLFRDTTIEASLATESFSSTGFGAVFADFDLDGWLDLAVANGAVTLNAEAAERGEHRALGQPNQLFRNVGGAYVEIVLPTDDAFRADEVGRGLARADLDNDGRIDLVLTNNQGPVRILRNANRAAAGWAGFELRSGPRIDPTATVEVWSEAGSVPRPAQVDGSYLSAQDPRVVVVVGDDSGEIVVRWSRGLRERFDYRAGAYQVLREGEGRPLDRAETVRRGDAGSAP